MDAVVIKRVDLKDGEVSVLQTKLESEAMIIGFESFSLLLEDV